MNSLDEPVRTNETPAKSVPPPAEKPVSPPQLIVAAARALEDFAREPCVGGALDRRHVLHARGAGVDLRGRRDTGKANDEGTQKSVLPQTAESRRRGGK